jgi:hypothetical protein
MTDFFLIPKFVLVVNKIIKENPAAASTIAWSGMMRLGGGVRNKQVNSKIKTDDYRFWERKRFFLRVASMVPKLPRPNNAPVVEGSGT